MLISVLLLFMVWHDVLSQPKIGGHVRDPQGTSLAGAHVSISSQPYGTYTDDAGYFEVEVQAGDTLVVSYVGYGTQRIPVYQFNGVVLLQPEIRLLPEIVVAASSHTTRRLFGFHRAKHDHAFQAGVGRRFLVRIENDEHRHGIIQKLHYALRNRVSIYVQDDKGTRLKPVSAVYRIQVRVHAVEDSGYPGRDLLTVPVLVEVAPGDHHIEVDISQYQIPFPLTGVFVGLDIVSLTGKNEKAKQLLSSSDVLGTLVEQSASSDKSLSYFTMQGRWIHKTDPSRWHPGRVLNYSFGLEASF